MPKIRDLLCVLNDFNLDEVIAFCIFHQNDVVSIVQELNQGEEVYVVTDEEINTILETVHNNQTDGMCLQDLANAYFELQEKKEEYNGA
jgi:hypothetical protein